MTTLQVVAEDAHRVGRIPVHNLWLLMLYASDVIRTGGAFKARFIEDAEDIPDLVATLLADEVHRRTRRSLTRGWRPHAEAITRVRGRIDMMTTETRGLMDRGQLFCHFQEITLDTPRNRLVRAALTMLGRSRLIARQALRDRCRSLAVDIGRAGVSAAKPSRADLAVDQLGRNDGADALMLALARLAFDLALPTEDAGANRFLARDSEEVWVRRLFEKAVLGFARVELEPLGWTVRGGNRLDWAISDASSGIVSILPGMVTDIILDEPGEGRRLVVDTKFNSILTHGRFQEVKLRSGYLYQMYAYLRSQERAGDSRRNTAAGLLLHPAIGETIREHVTIQGHQIRFATVDLTSPAAAIRRELRERLRG